MPPRRLPYLGYIAAAVGAAIVIACAQGSADDPTEALDATARPAESAVPADATAATRAGTAFGAAGLIPRNFPDASTEDWEAMYDGLPESGTLLGVYANWTDDSAPRGEVPQGFLAAYAAADRFGGFTPVVAVGFAAEDIRTGVMQPTVDWTNPDEIAEFTSMVTTLAEEHRPPFLFIGAEINRIWEQYPQDYAAFVEAWPALYDAVKAASPSTQVGTGFQLEFLRGGGYLSGETRQEQWALLDAFRDHADVIGFSTYPYFDYETPDAIPDDYYAVAAERAGLPIAFTEMGWPSQPLSTFPGSGYGGSEAEQAAFATRFLELIEPLDVPIALWSFPNDLGPPGGPAFESVGLRNNDGTPKPVLEVWGAAGE